jgi:hypothetical protein
MTNAKKSWFVLTVHGQAPVLANFRVYAESEEDAFKIFDRAPDKAQLDGRPLIDFRMFRKKRISIKSTMTGLIKWVRNF